MSGSPPQAPPFDAAFLSRICSMEDLRFVKDRMDPARVRAFRLGRLRIFHAAMMALSRHITAVSRQDWSSSDLAAGQIVLAEWRARMSWFITYARGVAMLVGAEIDVAPSAFRVYDALAMISGHAR